MKEEKSALLGRSERVGLCPSCCGRGTIAYPYCLSPSPAPIAGAPADAIQAFVCGSYSIFEATREASSVAQAEGVPVAFDFLDRTVVVGPGDDPDRVARAWWEGAYQETPEETWSRR
jgi:sugar/nucleoside kinase (ribokinase family)